MLPCYYVFHRLFKFKKAHSKFKMFCNEKTDVYFYEKFSTDMFVKSIVSEVVCDFKACRNMLRKKRKGFRFMKLFPATKVRRTGPRSLELPLPITYRMQQRLHAAVNKKMLDAS